MGHERLTRAAPLVAVGLDGEVDGPLKAFDVRVGVVGAAFSATTAVAPFVCFESFAPFGAVPFAPFRLGGFLASGERSTAASAATRREAFRAGRAAGTISAGRSARVRGATMVREVYQRA
jgi:hypothetical protein